MRGLVGLACVAAAAVFLTAADCKRSYEESRYGLSEDIEEFDNEEPPYRCRECDEDIRARRKRYVPEYDGYDYEPEYVPPRYNEERRYKRYVEYREQPRRFSNVDDDTYAEASRIDARYEVYEPLEEEEEVQESEVVEKREPAPISQDVQEDEDLPNGESEAEVPDQEEAASKHEHVYGNKANYVKHHHAGHGQKVDKGYKTVNQHDERAKGSDLNEQHKKQYKEHGGQKKYHHDGAGHYGQHEEAAAGHKGAKFDEKKGHKKGHKTKGYHNRYHKDEYHKEHKFYDDYHKSGSHHRYGNFKSKHGSNEQGHKKYQHLNSDKHADVHGKKGYHSKGHVDDSHRGHDNKKGHENHHASHGHYGNKGGHSGGKHYGYQQQH